MDIISILLRVVMPQFGMGVFTSSRDLCLLPVFMNVALCIVSAAISIHGYRHFAAKRSIKNHVFVPNSERQTWTALSSDLHDATIPNHIDNARSDSGEKKSVAVMFTDVVGFSCRMEENEERTLQSFQRDLRIIGQLTDKYGGAIVKTVGDGILVSFFSSVSAVRCALELQRRFAAQKQWLPVEYRLDHRVGIHVGEIIDYGHDIMGGTVNIAARLQQIAPPGGICISEALCEIVRHTVAFTVLDRERSHLKNIRDCMITYLISDHFVGQSHSVIMFPRFKRTAVSVR